MRLCFREIRPRLPVRCKKIVIVLDVRDEVVGTSNAGVMDLA